jgi:hypothetical protein
MPLVGRYFKRRSADVPALTEAALPADDEGDQRDQEPADPANVNS